MYQIIRVKLICISFVSSDDIFDGSPADRTLGIAARDEVLAAHEADAHVSTLVEDGVGVVVHADETVRVVHWCTVDRWWGCGGCCPLTHGYSQSSGDLLSNGALNVHLHVEGQSHHTLHLL